MEQKYLTFSRLTETLDKEDVYRVIFADWRWSPLGSSMMEKNKQVGHFTPTLEYVQRLLH